MPAAGNAATGGTASGGAAAARSAKSASAGRGNSAARAIAAAGDRASRRNHGAGARRRDDPAGVVGPAAIAARVHRRINVVDVARAVIGEAERTVIDSVSGKVGEQTEVRVPGPTSARETAAGVTQAMILRGFRRRN